MKILEHPHPVLREKCRLVESREFSSIMLFRLISDMCVLLEEKNGAGLAAPQIGQPIRLFVVAPGIIPAYKYGTDIEIEFAPVAIINPQITPYGDEIEYGEEGCLSIPNVHYRVRRHKRIKMVCQNANGVTREMLLEGWAARVCQHEMDHLDGTLILDRGRPVR